MPVMAKLSLRIDFGPNEAIGPGKIELIERIETVGSIAAAGRAMGMSYRHAWLLVDSVNQCFRHPVVTTKHGGRAGGGARLTPFGRELVRRYRAIERSAQRAANRHLDALQGAKITRAGNRVS